MKILVNCKHCNEEFEKKGNNNTFCSKECYKKHYREKESEYVRSYRQRTPTKNLLKAAKSRAKSRGIPFDITEEDIVLVEHCPILGIKLKTNSEGHGGRDDSYSLDRIDPEKGYVKGNVQVISHKANSMKFTATPSELLMFAEWIIKTYKEEQ